MRGVKPIYQLRDDKWIVNWSVSLEDSCVFRNRTMTGTVILSCGLTIAYRVQPIRNKIRYYHELSMFHIRALKAYLNSCNKAKKCTCIHLMFA